MPQETKTAPGASPNASTKPSALQGLVATRDDEAALLKALENAFDYRGDVTVETTDGSQFSGYIFDRRRGETLGDSCVRLMTAKSDDPVVVTFDRIASLSFTGKDAAHGKSFETWVKKYLEKKLAGEDASIYSETIEE